MSGWERWVGVGGGSTGRAWRGGDAVVGRHEGLVRVEPGAMLRLHPLHEAQARRPCPRRPHRPRPRRPPGSARIRAGAGQACPWRAGPAAALRPLCAQAGLKSRGAVRAAGRGLGERWV